MNEKNMTCGVYDATAELAEKQQEIEEAKRRKGEELDMNYENKTAKELYELAMSKWNLLDAAEKEYEEKYREVIELLEEAAEQGYEPAIDELRDIYYVEDESQV